MLGAIEQLLLTIHREPQILPSIKWSFEGNPKSLDIPWLSCAAASIAWMLPGREDSLRILLSTDLRIRARSVDVNNKAPIAALRRS
jgi:hypothetical protein